MERGSGSSVCRLNFNFPLLKQNSISVEKELTVDNQNGEKLLGNPDYKFQVLKANADETKTSELFIAAGTAYDICDTDGNVVGAGTVDDNGVFTLKAGQRAVFSGINENAGKYYVRELIDTAFYEQYGTITVDGNTSTKVENITIGSDSFTGSDSTVKDASDGSTLFHFNNQVTFNKVGNLEISKVLEKAPTSETSASKNFDFIVTLSGENVPVGTEYEINGESGTKKVTTAGIITVPAGKKAVLSNVIAGTSFTVKEESVDGYEVSYTGSTGVKVEDGIASGKIAVGTSVNVTATNKENYIQVDIPVTKNISNTDGTAYEFNFSLVQVTDESGNTETTKGTTQNKNITVDSNGTGEATFTLYYLEKDITSGSQKTYYYKIKEVPDANLEESVKFDDTAYVVGVTVSRDDSGIQAQKKFYKNGSELTGAAASVIFNNTLLSELSITKEVAGLPKDGQKFSFTVELKQNGRPLTGEFTAARTGKSDEEAVEFGSDGKACIELEAGETLTIKKIPYGTVWKVTETSTTGYEVKYEVENSDETTGSAASGTLGKANAVTFTNKQLADLELMKTNPEGTKLADVKLELYTDVKENASGTEAFKYNGINYYKVRDITTSAEVTTTIENLPVYTLRNGSYEHVNYLIKETEAAEGYAVLEECVVFHFKEDNSVEIENKQDCFKVKTDGTLQIINYELSELPATGGNGTFLFTITGAGILMLAALLFLYSRKRRGIQ